MQVPMQVCRCMLMQVCMCDQAHRRDDDIAIVNAGMRVRMAQDSKGAALGLLTSCSTETLLSCAM